MSDAPLSFSVDTGPLVAVEQQAEKTATALNKVADATDKVDWSSEAGKAKMYAEGMDRVYAAISRTTGETIAETKARYEAANAARDHTDALQSTADATNKAAEHTDKLTEAHGRLHAGTERTILGVERLVGGVGRLANVMGVNGEVIMAIEGATRALSRMDTASNLLGGNFGKIVTIGGAVATVFAGAAAGVKYLVDEYENEERRLTSLYGSQTLALQAYQDIQTQALATGESLKVAADQYERFAKATTGLGATSSQNAAISSIVAQTGRLGGASPGEQTASVTALSAILKENVVSARELETLFASMPGLVQTIADGLGVSVTQLKLMSQTGKLTNDDVFRGLLQQQQAVSDKFKDMGLTLGGFFTNIMTGISDMVVGLYKAATAIELVHSKADAARRAQAANPNRPARATPRSIGDASGVPAELLIPFTDAPDLGDVNSQILDQRRADLSQATSQVLAAGQIASELDPLSKELSTIGSQTKIVTDALTKLQGGMTDLTADQAAAQVVRLTNALATLQQKALDAGSAYQKSLNASGEAQLNRDLGLTSGQAATLGRAQQFQTGQPGLSSSDAIAQANQEQIDKLDVLIEKKQQELAMQDAITAAMKHGKAAADDVSVAYEVMALQLSLVGEITPDVQVKLDLLADTLGRLKADARAQAGVNASKPLLDDLAAIAAAQKVVADGSYAMARAQAEAKAAASDNGTGPLQMKVFDARQVLTDAQTIENLRIEVALENQLAAAAGNTALQKQIQLQADIDKASKAAAPTSRADIAEQMRQKAAAEQNRTILEGNSSLEKQIQLTVEQTQAVTMGTDQYNIQLAMLQKKRDLIQAGVDVENNADAKKQINLAGQLANDQNTLRHTQEAADANKQIWQTAFDDTQKAGADAFYGIFTNAGVTGASVANSLKNIYLRAFADIAAAAIIRPLIQPIFGALSSIGVAPSGIGGSPNYGIGFNGAGVSPVGAGSYGPAPNTGGSFGGSFGSGTSSFGGGSFGGGGLNNLFSNYGGFQNFLSTPIAGGYAGISPVGPGVFGPAPNTVGGGLEGVGGSGLFGSGVPSPTFGSAIGGGLSIGMGALTLANSKGTGSTIAGVGGMVGGALMMIPTPWTQAAGAVISIGSQIIGGIIGDGGPKIPQQPPLVYNYGGSFIGNKNGLYTSDGAQAGDIGGQVTSLFRMGNLKTVPGAMYGGDFATGVDTYLQNGQWQPRPYTQAGIYDPKGNYTPIQYDHNMSAQAAAELAAVTVFSENIHHGGVSNASKTLLAGFDTIAPTTIAQAQSIITLSMAYDKLGKAATPVKDQLDKISHSFDDLTDFAAKANLSLQPLNDEMQTQFMKIATDFGTSIQRQLDDLTDPMKGQLSDLVTAKQGWIDTNSEIVANIIGAQDQIANIEKLYAAKRTQIVEQSLSTQLGDISALIARLTTGDLSGQSATTLLSITKANYQAKVAQAQAGDNNAIATLATPAGDYVNALIANYGSTQARFQQTDQILQALQNIVSGVTAGALDSTSQMGSTDQAQQIQSLLAALAASNDNVDRLQAMVTALTGQLARGNLYAGTVAG